jgi:nucleoside-diphosphate-sugar epimerase
MKIAITGASGNLGSELLAKFKSESLEVSALSLLNFNPDNISENQFDVLIHAGTCYGRNGEKFSDIILANLLIPLKIMELAKPKFFINIDTTLEEKVSNYAFSKACFSKACRHLIEQGLDVKIINVKLHNFYGTKPSKSDLIYNLTRQFLQNIDSIDLTEGEQKRDFIFIEDVVFAIDAMMKNLNLFSEKFNEVEVGTGESISVKDVVLTIKNLTKSKTIPNFGAIPLRKNEPANLFADVKEMKKFNWVAKTSIEEGINKIIKNIT